MLKILKPKIIFVDQKFKITLNNNVMKVIRAAPDVVLVSFLLTLNIFRTLI